MVCIYCNKGTKVTNSRPQRKLNRIWRRRSCSYCGAAFTTIECIDPSAITVVTNSDKNTDLVPFSRDNLYISIYESCRHRQEAISDATQLTDTVISKLMKAMKNGVLGLSFIKDVTHDTLKRFDQAAAMHYKAYYLKN